MNRQHKTAMKICKILIDSELSISEQLEVVKGVQKRLEFCKIAGMKNNQLSLL